MTRAADTGTRIALLAVAVIAIVASFAIAADADFERTTRFVWLSLLSLVVVIAGSPGLDIIQGYTKRRPIRLSWGKPRADLGPEKEGPSRTLPGDQQIIAALRPAPLMAALAGSAAVALIFGALSYALAGSASPNGSGLILYVVFAAAARQTATYGFRLLSRSSTLTIEAESARLGPALGYVPPLTIPRHTVEAIETSAEQDKLAFVTADRRFEVSTAMLIDSSAVESQLAGLWPEVAWHELSPDAIRTTFDGSR